jgi:hypothetical protein
MKPTYSAFALAILCLSSLRPAAAGVLYSTFPVGAYRPNSDIIGAGSAFHNAGREFADPFTFSLP